jgi:hypothetical protein
MKGSDFLSDFVEKFVADTIKQALDKYIMDML